MKTTIKKTLSFLTIFSMVMVYSSCTEDDPVEPGPPGGNGPPTNSNVIKKDINTKTVLKNHLSGIDYEICGNVDVNAELIIEPGVEIVMCSGANVSVGKNGSLNAVGSSSLPIIIRGKTASKGFWGALHFNSNNPKNVLDFVTVANGGGSSYYSNASIFVNDNNNGQLTMMNSTVKNSKGRGLEVESGGATIPDFTNNIFTSNGDAPVKLSMAVIGSLDLASDYGDNNTKNHVIVSKEKMNQPQVVKNINVPYLIEGTSDINDELKLNPGVEFLMASGVGINVTSGGSFNAIGTSTDSITIKGAANAVGYWDCLHINSNNPLNEFAYVNVKNGGSRSYYDYSSIWVNDNNNGTFIMKNCSISDSHSWGVIVENGAALTPSTKSAVESANTFINNGTGVNASCSGSCSVYFE